MNILQKPSFVITFFLLFFPLFLWGKTADTAKVRNVKPGSVKTIIIDAGHGLPDPGAQGKYSNESDITLAIALKVGEKLRRALPNTKILYTRTDKYLPNRLQNKDVANRYRASFANDNNGDLFVSIHVNDIATRYGRRVVGTKQEKYTVWEGKKKKRRQVTKTRTVNIYEKYKLPCEVRGTQTYVWSAAKNDEKKEFINEHISIEYDEDSTFDANDPENRIIAALYLKKYFGRSKQLAEMVEDEFRKVGIPSAGGAMQMSRGIRVLGATAMPSILIETGFICNPQDEDYLNSMVGQEQISTGIATAIINYKKNIEQTSFSE